MNNPIACTTGGYPGHDLDRVLLGLSKAGFRHVELSAIPSPRSRIIPEQMNADDIRRFQEKLAGYGLTPVSVSGHADLAQPEGVAQFKARIEFAAALGVRIINTGTGHTPARADEDRFFTFMKNDLLPYAADRGVTIALETHGGLTGTAEDCLKTLHRLDSTGVGINYDPANVIYYRGVRPETDIVKLAPHVIHVHVKDQRGGQGVDDFPLPGTGEIDFAVIIAVLAQAGYAGPLSVELELKQVGNTVEEDEIRLHCRQFVEQLVAGRGR
jgi:sugar phosphate isomerase/epimerase